MKKKLLLFATILIAASCNTAPENDSKSEQPNNSDKGKTAVYGCPMDCEHGKTYEAKETCPVCGMQMEPK